MEARMPHPAMAAPGAMEALHALTSSVKDTGLTPTLLEMVNLRASQINGCSVCVLAHTNELRKLGENDDRIAAVAAWREAPYFNPAERAALDLTEATTRLADRPDPVPDRVWQAAAAHYDQIQLAGLVLAIATINIWNRLNTATQQIAGKEW